MKRPPPYHAPLSTNFPPAPITRPIGDSYRQCVADYSEDCVRTCVGVCVFSCAGIRIGLTPAPLAPLGQEERHA
jgi:hypothetical protein